MSNEQHHISSYLEQHIMCFAWWIHYVQEGEVDEYTKWVTVTLKHPEPTIDDWVGVFSPGKFKLFSSSL